MTLGEIAANLNLPVFPCDSEKFPCTKSGFKDAVTDKKDVIRLFSDPRSTLIGVPTGEISGIVVIDIDVKDGARGMEWLNDNSDSLPETRTHKTRTGGLHLVFKYPVGFEIRNSASKIAPGIDCRGNGGYVIYPPSTGYQIADNVDPEEMPQWLIRACQEANSKTATHRPEQYQTPGAVNYTLLHDTSKGTSWGLKALDGECEEVARAPFGEQEATLNAAALKIGALSAGGQLNESYGKQRLISAGNMMSNAPGRSKWTPRDIEEKVRRGIEHGKSSPRRPKDRIIQHNGHSTSVHEPENEQIGMDEVPCPPWEVYLDGVASPSEQASGNPKKSLIWLIDEPWAESDIPLRPWIVRGFLLRGSLTVVSGAGSAGKSSLMIAWAVSIGLGLPHGRFRPEQTYRVLSYNVEDDRDEQKRRISATCRQFASEPRSLIDNVRMVGPTEMGTLLHIGPDGRLLINTPVMTALEEYIDVWHPDVIILDPFVELHSSEENDNTAIRQVLARFRSWAVQRNIALVVLHHARKGASSPGDPDSMRGASAIVGAARIALTVNTMTDQEAADMGIPVEQRRDYFRMDGAKMNYSRVQDADWYERVEYQLDNDEGVAAAVPWQVPKQIVNLSHVGSLISMVEKGTSTGPYSPKISREPRSIRAAMEAIGVTLFPAQKELLSFLMNDPSVFTSTFKSSVDRVKRQGLKTENGPVAEWI
jgi:hypothetical protein